MQASICPICASSPNNGKISLLLAGVSDIVFQTFKFIERQDQAFKLIGQEKNWPEALTKIKNFSPEIVILDSHFYPLSEKPLYDEKAKKDFLGVKFALLMRQGDVAHILERCAQGFDGLLDFKWHERQLLTALHYLFHEGWVLPRVANKELIRQIHLWHQLLRTLDPYGLTTKEKEALVVLRQNATEKKAAQAMRVSANTFRTHLKHIRRKLGVHSKIEALVKTAAQLTTEK